VWEYVRRLPQHGDQVELLTFEFCRTPDLVVPRGVSWQSADFGRLGAAGAARRFGRLVAKASRSRQRILHARADLPAMAALAARHPSWVWDMRSFWREQRIALGAMSQGGALDKAFQQVERLSAHQASAIICLANEAREVLRKRYGDEVAQKVRVIPTAVDTSRFVPDTALRKTPRVLISGSFNGFYDGSLTVRFLEKLAERTAISTAWIGATSRSPWFFALKEHVDDLIPPVPFLEMPQIVGACDVGLVLCRLDAGNSLAGAMPTKAAEFLSAGVPIVVTRGTGDLEDLVTRYQCGVVVREDSDSAIATAADELLSLWSQPETKERARVCALEIFDLDRAVEKLSAIYADLAE